MGKYCAKCKINRHIKQFTKDEAYETEPQICNICKEELEKQATAQGIEFITEARTSRRFGTFGDDKEIIDTFAVLDGKKHHLGGVPKKANYMELQDAFTRKEQFVKNKGKYVKFYTLGTQGDMNPVEFVQHAIDNGLLFREGTEILLENENDTAGMGVPFWEFRGTFKKVSEPFNFRIFSVELAKEVMEMCLTNYSERFIQFNAGKVTIPYDWEMQLEFGRKKHVQNTLWMGAQK